MSENLRVESNIILDVTKSNIISIRAKQYDLNTRYILAQIVKEADTPVDLTGTSIYIKTYDGKTGTMDNCEIIDAADGKIMIKLSKVVLSRQGRQKVDIVIVEGENENEDGKVLTTMSFSLVVEPSVYEAEVVEAQFPEQYSSLNDILVSKEELIEASEESVQAAKDSEAWAVGKIDGVGVPSSDPRYHNNSKYYSSQAETSASEASSSEDNAKSSELNAKSSEENAKASELNAKTSENNALSSANSASTSEANALSSKNDALTYAVRAQSYTKGDTGTRPDEDVDNAEYYYLQSKSIAQSLSGALRPKGTITFSQLPTTNIDDGDMYNISDSFVTDNRFREGAGRNVSAGSNVYYTVDGMWDVLAGGVRGFKVVNGALMLDY